MTDDQHLDKIMRISPDAPLSLDVDLAQFDPIAAKPGQALFPDECFREISARLFEPISAICFGVRITEKTTDIDGLAMKVARMAYERNAEPIILSHIAHCGLERFGFRVERVAGQTEAERAACEAELTRFWNIVVVI
jgi:hypothetical protein